MICLVITKLRSDRVFGMTPSAACQQNLRRTCSCDLHDAWRRSEAELNRLRKLIETTSLYRHQTHGQAEAKVLADGLDPDYKKPGGTVIHYYGLGDSFSARCGAAANTPNSKWVGGGHEGLVTCNKCRAALATPVSTARKPDETDDASNGQGNAPPPAPLELHRRRRVARVKDGRQRRRARRRRRN